MNRLMSIALGLAITLMFSMSARADDFKADPVHSFAVFDVHHFSAGYVYGMFSGPSGSVSYDASDPSKSSFDLTVKIAGLDTRNSRRDSDLKGPDYFDAKQYPEMTFKSTSVTKTGDNKMDVTGDLTIKGVTKSITVPMEMTGIGHGPPAGTRIGFRTEFKVNRTDYGVGKAPENIIGNEIHIVVAIEATPK